MVDSVDVSRLGAVVELDRGAFGTVHRLESYAMAGFAELAYKEFSTAVDSDQVANLTALVKFRTRLDANSRRVLDDATAWPLRLVTDRRRVCGFVMQLIPAAFFSSQRLPSGRTVELPTKAQWLVVDPARADDAGIIVPSADDLPARIVLCAKLAHAFGVLHRAGLIYGDLSLNNAMFSAGVPPRIMLVDCDAVQARQCAPVRQAHTADWTPPECVSGGKPQDVYTDRYKLALFILRVLTPGAHASQAMDPNRLFGVLDLEGNSMMRDALDTNRSRRPSAKEWFDYLCRRLSELTTPPAVTELSVDTTVAPAGSMVTVSWRTAGATRVTLSSSDGFTVECDAAAGNGQPRLAVTRSGPFTLTATNRYGTTTLETDPVFAVEPPMIQRVELPQLASPRLDLGLKDICGQVGALRPPGPHPVTGFRLADLTALRSEVASPSHEASAADPLVDIGCAAEQVSGAMRTLGDDARMVLDYARAASAAAAQAAGESVHR
ncbi:hypothetical protein NWT09_31020 [Mycolicibacterium sp. jd]|uniref:hypothetical protein n=1 Tax=unclassified Mycolicibacterium TaxID=2636767 RepID=UPI00351B730E